MKSPRDWFFAEYSFLSPQRLSDNVLVRGRRRGNDDDINVVVAQNLIKSVSSDIQEVAITQTRGLYLVDAIWLDNFGRGDSLRDQSIFRLLHVFLDDPEQLQLSVSYDVVEMDAASPSKAKKGNPQRSQAISQFRAGRRCRVEAVVAVAPLEVSTSR